ncbi:kinase-like domain-containing protein, partial [Epithele typhae]|uniref:kinase-like domain-containing protein n=1 Tax=Epithele typhae TaxID=378194 RepID=UPI002007366E
YSILGTLGEGGFGRVFAARRNINQVVAVKVTHKWKHYRKGQGDRASLLRERDCMALAALNNVPFWAKLLASWEDAHNVYFVMVSDERRRSRPLSGSPEYLRRSQVLAVSYLEKHEIIHSDIKPENFLVTSREDHLVLTDFGVADRRPSASDVPFDEWYLGGRAGTTTYMSPETLLLEETYHRSDIYSLGLVFLQVFLGW